MTEIRLNLGNYYDRGLFGFHHTLEQLDSMIGLNIDRYHETRRMFETLCAKLGDRQLAYLDNGSMTITPQPVNPELSKYMAGLFGLSMVDLSFMDGSSGNNEDLAMSILNDPVQMDNLRKWANKAGNNSNSVVLNPRTITPGTITLAAELGISHGHRYTNGLFGGRNLEGIYPKLYYIETNPAQRNNSKVENYLILKQVDFELGTDLAPEGDVAFDLRGISDVCDQLIKSGKEIMIKTDLSVDGMGNLHINPDEKYDSELPFKDLDSNQKQEVILREMKKRGLFVGPTAGVVVTEFLVDKVSDPSVEVYSPPLAWKEMGYEPVITYDCGMLIENGGFAGSVIPNPDLEEKTLIDEASRVVLEFSRRRWLDGYVGINDADLAICVDKRTGRRYVKILEFNYNRETGGTASDSIKSRLDRMHNQHGVLIARDRIQGPNFAHSLPTVVGGLDGIGYGSNDSSGAIILGHRINNGVGDIMSVVYARNMHDAMMIDARLKLASGA